MIFGLGILATALLLSVVAAYYSVAGLTAIFSAATVPVIIMGASLELGKIVATVWLHNNWKRAGVAFKLYLIPAVAFLMLLTSMGIFGYLSKAHSDQSLVTGDSTAKIAIYDEKIKIERENIDANRKALKQLDEAVDQVMGRSTDERGAERAVQIRRSQQAERGRLLKEIEQSQKRITTLNEERAPLAAEYRKVEAEVGPIKYIAALVYGDSADQNVLEKAVRFVIIMIVLVFDPLALTLILAANKQFEWARRGQGGFVHDEEMSHEPHKKIDQELSETVQYTDIEKKSEVDQFAYLKKPFIHFKNLKPMPAVPPAESEQHSAEEYDTEDSPEIKEAKSRWKAENPDDTLKHQRTLYERGIISELPWMKLVADNDQTLKISQLRGFGIKFPDDAVKGDTFIRVDQMPSVLYKYNGMKWIEVDKTMSDQYAYDIAYIDHLIEKLTSGEYDPDLLNDAEREQVAQRLRTKPKGE